MDQENITDEQLIDKIREENPDFYSEIVRRYSVKLRRYISRIINDYDKSEDILQDVFIKAYRNLYDFNINKKFSSWIYRIAHNESINYIKKVSREKSVSLEDIIDDVADSGSVETDIDRIILKEQIEKCLERLDVKYREPLVLYFFEQKSYDEISDILRIPINTVGTLISRGKKTVKKIYSDFKYE